MPYTRFRALLTVAALAAAGLGGGGAGAAPADELPVAGCQTVADTAGDSGDADLDITGLTFRTVPGSLLAYVKVANLQAGPAVGDGHRFTVSFTVGETELTMAASAYRNGTGMLRDEAAKTGLTGSRTSFAVENQQGTRYARSGLAVRFDQARDYVVMQLPTIDIERAALRGLSGFITNASATSGVDGYATEAAGDSTPRTSWAVGDNRCFQVPTRIAFSVAKFPARRNVTATLTSPFGPMPGQQVTFFLNGRRHSTLTTASNGAVTLTNVKPGSKVTAQFVPAPGSGYLGTSAGTKV